MKTLAVGLLVIVGCQAPDDFDINPGGGGGTGGNNGNRDAAIDGNDAGANLLGRVCIVGDLRAPTTGCANTGADGITVTLGAKTATTNTDGSFEIERPAGSNPVWHAFGGAIVTSAMPFSADFTIPAITVDDYATLLATNGVVPQAGQGSIIDLVVTATGPLADARATTISPAPEFAPFYDGTSAALWDRDRTSVFGVIWITGAVVGPATVTVTPMVGTAQATTHTVEDGAITFATIEFP